VSSFPQNVPPPAWEGTWNGGERGGVVYEGPGQTWTFTHVLKGSETFEKRGRESTCPVRFWLFACTNKARD